MDGDILQQGHSSLAERFGLPTLARLVSLAVETAAQARGVGLTATVLPGAPAQLVGDVASLGALVNALTLSAIDAAPPGPLALRLSATAGGGDNAFLRVELVGGFSAGDGDGFGLDLARRVVATAGARLALDRLADGAARIVLTIPVGLPAPVADPDRLARWARSRGGRLLVVDDSDTNRMVTAGLLSKAGFSVEMASGGAEAVVAVAKSAVPPEAVLMDVAMPEMDGVAATATIRSLSGERGRVPIIAVTANTQSEDRSRCLAAGMNDYVVKPVRRADLLAALERWLAVPSQAHP